jgi:NAD(P)-dependent dehydrogenase (short-subunit alcohol dehydrogenase family)
VPWSSPEPEASHAALQSDRCTPEDIAEVIMFLMFLACAGAMITGQTIVVDGGLTL